MAIGVNWGEVWDDVWLAVWQQTPIDTSFPVGRQQDFPNPVVADHVLLVHIHRSAYDPPPPPPPEFPVGRLRDWPNPGVDLEFAGHEFEHLHYSDPPPVVPPFRQLEWPNPVVEEHAQQPALQPNLLTSTLFVPPPGMPIGRLLDWPNPIVVEEVHPQYEFTGRPLPNEIPPAVIPPDVVPPSFYPTGSSTGGGGGGAKDWWEDKLKGKKRRTVYDDLRKDIQEVRVEEGLIRDVYAELKKSEMAAQAAGEAVRPYQGAKGEIEWGGVARDPQAVRALMQAALQEQRRREIAEDDAEWELF